MAIFLLCKLLCVKGIHHIYCMYNLLHPWKNFDITSSFGHELTAPMNHHLYFLGLAFFTARLFLHEITITS